MKNKKCVPCTINTPKLSQEQVDEYLLDLEGWTLNQEGHLVRSFSFKNFKEALAFTNRVGLVAEDEGHHPDIKLSWGKVDIELFTHKINALSENDFILAKELEALLN